MNRNKFMTEKSKPLKVCPRPKSIISKTESEAAFIEDMLAMENNRCLFLNENIEIEKFKIRYHGNDYYLRSINSVPGKLTITAKTEIWHEPT